MSKEQPVETETQADPILEALAPEDGEKPEEVKETEAQEEEVEEDALGESPEEPEAPEEESEKPKETKGELDPKEEARKRYEEREMARAERRKKVEEQAQNYVKQAEDEYEQRIRAVEAREYQNLIEHNENTLLSEFDRVKANPSLQMFNPDSEKFNQRLFNKAVRDYNAGYLEYDRNENLTRVKGSLYQHLTETAELYQDAVKSGAFQQVRDAKKMRVSADSKTAATPKESKKDPILEVLQSED